MAKNYEQITKIGVNLVALTEQLQQSDEVLQQWLDESPFDTSELTVAEFRIVGNYLLANANKVPYIYGF